jgi:preprotein translocase subunit SecD
VNKRPLQVTLVVTILIVLVAGVYLGMGARPQLGLDLQGGISGVYVPQLPEGQDPDEIEDFEEILDETIEVIRSRVDSLGVAEPDISRQGTNVLVQLPGVTDADRLRELIGQTAQLTFRPVLEVYEPGTEEYDEAGPDCDTAVDELPELADDEEAVVCGAGDEIEGAETDDPPKYLVGPAALTGSGIDDAFPAIDQSGGQGFNVSLALDRQGARDFAQITGDLACERDQGGIDLLAIVLDGRVESAPSMNPDVACGTGITGGNATITVGQGTQQEQQEEAEDLALVLRTGALPISLEEATFSEVSPTLGQESLQSGLLAGMIGLFLVSLWLLFFYRWLGVVAIAEVAIYGVMIVALISLMGELGFALTLAGVAGIIVSIGITADSAIIFFERIRDEINLGKTVRTSVIKAHHSAWRTNLAGNAVTIAAAVILYFLAVGPVRGFALMLGISSVLDLLIMWFFARPVVMLMGNTKLVTRKTLRAADAPRGRRAAATGVAGGAR